MNAKLNLPRSAASWELYTDMPGVGTAARLLTAALSAALKAPGATRASVRTAVGKVMSEQAGFGACDSEPVYVLEAVLDRKFGRQF